MQHVERRSLAAWMSLQHNGLKYVIGVVDTACPNPIPQPKAVMCGVSILTPEKRRIVRSALATEMVASGLLRQCGSRWTFTVVVFTNGRG